MCQTVTGPKVKLKERWAWKVFQKGDGGQPMPLLYAKDGGEAWENPFPYRLGVWHQSTGVCSKSTVFGEETRRDRTCGGFHVLRTKKKAEAYILEFYAFLDNYLILRVRIRGEALPFEEGWAVHEMRIPEPSESRRKAS